jgi:anti-sigma factor RsiW
MSDKWTDRLSEYLDAELDARERVDLEAHLGTCPACSATLEELRRVVTRAQTVEDRPPTADLWPGIAERIGLSSDDLSVRRRSRRFSFNVPQLIAASLALIVLSGGTVWLMRPTSHASALSSSRDSVAVAMNAVFTRAQANTDQAVKELRTALEAGQSTGRLSPKTVAKLQYSLAVIDSSIAQAQRALAQDPQSAYLNHHLADTMRRKIEFLRQANRVAAET